jgi:uncharacterized protein YbjT (DUF2867 family)
MKIIVIGGTGLIGSKVVEKLARQGHEVIAAAPNTGVNTVTGEGLSEVLAGAEVVVDVANSPSFEDGPAMDFFQTAGRNVAAAEAAAGVRHHVALSVVGTDRLQASGYFRAKLAQEAIIKGSGIPYTIVHATQFFEFIRSIPSFSTKDGAVHLPPVRFQPIAADDVAAAVAEAALSTPANRIVEVGGPETFGLDEAVRKVMAYDHDPRAVVSDSDAPYFGVPVSERTLVPDDGARLGMTRLDWWLDHVPPPPEKPVAAPAIEQAQS